MNPPTMNEEKLLLCPFCGKIPKLYNQDPKSPFVQCKSDGCIMLNDAQWLDRWNTRAPTPPASAPAKGRVTVTDEMVHAALDAYAAGMEKWGFFTSAMRAALEAALVAAIGEGESWVKCSERMPPDFCDDAKDPGEPIEVFACDKTGKRWMDWVIYRSHNGKREWCRRNTVPLSECSWRPLPPPPAAGESGGEEKS